MWAVVAVVRWNSARNTNSETGTLINANDSCARALENKCSFVSYALLGCDARKQLLSTVWP